MPNLFLCKNILRVGPMPVQCQSYPECESNSVVQLNLRPLKLP